MIFVTGGAGFIGSNFVLDWLSHNDEPVVNIDKLTYAGNLDNLASLRKDPRHIFVQCDINNASDIAALFATHKPRAIVHFAAETHVDRSIDGPGEFIRTNINGTFSLLDAARGYWRELPEADQRAFRFLHISTDEVYGSLEPNDPPFTETTAYAPNSPYSASKAASDHLVRAYRHTYGLPTLTINCSNNYGPHQFPEKLIPLMIANGIARKSLPIYGDGKNVRDWLYVGDHCSAIRLVLAKGQVGDTYNIGGRTEKTNTEIVHTICDLLDELVPDAAGSYRRLVSFVEDRRGHDRRYAVAIDKIEQELGWQPTTPFAEGIRHTVEWWLAHRASADIAKAVSTRSQAGLMDSDTQGHRSAGGSAMSRILEASCQ